MVFLPFNKGKGVCYQIFHGDSDKEEICANKHSEKDVPINMTIFYHEAAAGCHERLLLTSSLLGYLQSSNWGLELLGLMVNKTGTQR